MPEAEKSLDWRTCCWFAADVKVTIFVEKINLSRFPSLELNSFFMLILRKKNCFFNQYGGLVTRLYTKC